MYYGFLTEASKLADTAKNAIEETVTRVVSALDATKTSTDAAINSTLSTVESVKEQSVKSLSAIDRAMESVKTAAVDAGAAGMVVVNSLKDVPKTAQELAAEMPKIAQRLRYRAGVRVGDAPRSDADVMKLFEKIPGTSKLGARENTIRQFLRDKHGSHIYPRSQGGSNAADNIVWEIGADNIRRGAKVMTIGEQFHIRVYNAVDSIVANSGAIARLGITATGTAILTQVTVTAISYSLDLYRGDITVDKYKELIFETASSAGIATPVVFLVLVAVLALLPEFAVLLSAPVVVAGFNALFGMSIAIPIIESLVRHLQAGGFGTEAAQNYQNLLGLD
ncbi:MAG: HNH endonuclease [Calothrix sp. SM1_7_51]|nr:HNH endonuclease [Calothrix sp. SM1_7_51]